MKKLTYIFCVLFLVRIGYSQDAKSGAESKANDQTPIVNSLVNKIQLNSDTKEIINKEALKKNEADLKVNSSNSFDYQYLKYINSNPNNKDFTALQNAYNILPTNSDVQFEMAKYYELNNNVTSKKEFCLKLNKSVSQGLKEYAYNTLMSVEKNGILITYGKDDTYPIWILQELEGVRKDVKVLNYDLLVNDSYRKKQETTLGLKFAKSYLNNIEILKDVALKNPDKTIYYSLTISHLVLKELKNNLYATGLALKYSVSSYDNLSVIKNNWENSFKKTQLLKTQKTGGVDTKIEMNYILSLVQLSKHYENLKQLKQYNELKELAIVIAKRNGKEAEVKNLFN